MEDIWPGRDAERRRLGIAEPKTFLNGKVTVIQEDSRYALKGLPDASIDSVVTDPPYALVSIVKRFGADGAAACIVPEGGTGAYARASAGFMGKKWDTGETAFHVDFWAEVLRVLKPGGHVLAFGGTRTYHRLACAIEDAGFEIRDMVSWIYGSGFPKSHDVSKGIDKRGGAQISWFGPWLREERERRGITQRSLAEHFPSKTGGMTGCVANWELGFNLPTADQFNTLCRILSLPFQEIAEAEREVIGQVNGNLLAVAPGQNNDRSATTLDITAPATEAAATWEGWGTALKPALEPIVLARKPLVGTVAANVLEHGTGAINIDGCRIPGEKPQVTQGINGNATSFNVARERRLSGDPNEGRWPANVIHDGSEEVLAGFPDREGATSNGRSGEKGVGNWGMGPTEQIPGYGDSGSAARFFASFPMEEQCNRFWYTSKADSDDRIGSKHPTVKPVA